MHEPNACEWCETQMAPGLLACPGCHRLVHGERLKDLASSADQAERAGDLQAALIDWREALELLPAGTRQREQVEARIAELGRRADAAPVAPSDGSAHASEVGASEAGWSGKAGLTGLGALGLFLFKFKFALIFLVAKAKFLVLGLTKASTFLSMLAFFGVYWQLFGWKFGLGLVLSIYVHEMGHVYLLHRYGIKAGAPMFIPGLGALVRLKQAMTDPRQDARVGLAGPVWGTAAALASYAGSLAFDSPVLAAIARMGAFLNLFNLMPLWQLDGGRAFRALSRSQRWLAAAAVGLAWAQTSEGLLVILMMCAAFRAVSEPGPKAPDRGVLVEYVVLVFVLSALLMIPVAV